MSPLAARRVSLAVRFTLVLPLALGVSLVFAQPPQRPVTAVPLGPRDGRDLPPADLNRVHVGRPAPDFTLETAGGRRVTLSEFRGAKRVVLVFYRGHW